MQFSTLSRPPKFSSYVKKTARLQADQERFSAGNRRPTRSSADLNVQRVAGPRIQLSGTGATYQHLSRGGGCGYVAASSHTTKGAFSWAN
jgi:hypothetical protein